MMLPPLAALVVALALLTLSAAIHIKAQGAVQRSAVARFEMANVAVVTLAIDGDADALFDGVTDCILSSHVPWRVFSPEVEVDEAGRDLALRCIKVEADHRGQNAKLATAIYAELENHE